MIKVHLDAHETIVMKNDSVFATEPSQTGNEIVMIECGVFDCSAEPPANSRVRILNNLKNFEQLVAPLVCDTVRANIQRFRNKLRKRY